MVSENAYSKRNREKKKLSIISLLSTALDYRATKGVSSSATDIKLEISKGFGKKMKGTGSGRINLRFLTEKQKINRKYAFAILQKR